ncbi:zinc finger protein RFP isoform X2 [Pogona vitticeps]
MASASIQDLCEEATCSICLDYFKDPVTIECGHNFCRACLTQSWEGLGGGKVSCPQCREKVRRSLFPNRQLGNFVDLSKKLRLQEETITERKGGACDKHQEPLKLFCKVDEAPICMDLIYSRLELLKKERANILAHKAETEGESQELLKQVNAERQQLLAQFTKLHIVMEKKRCNLLARLQELDKVILKQRDQHNARLTKQGDSLHSRIQEMEDKCQQPVTEFLQDIGSIIQKCEAGLPQVPAVFPPEIKKHIQEFSDINCFLQRVMNQFEDALLAAHQLCKEAITLDPATAHPYLSLSKDQRCVRLQPTGQYPPDIPERFDTCTCVLGSEGFRTGRHWWEVEVDERGVWAAGVAVASVRRKGLVHFNPKEGIWAVGQMQGGHYQALTTTKHNLLLKQKLRKIRVTLDCKKNEVAFVDSETESPVFKFSSATFATEEVFPWFWLGRLATQLRLTL